MNQIFHHWSGVATDSTSWDYPVCTLDRDTLWHQHYVRTSKEYLINCHILLQYFELAFLHLQLVQILCKLIIIWVNYKKNKKGSFYETLCMYCLCCLLQNCVEQPFDSPPHISVSKNTALSDNFAANIHNCLAGVTAKLGMLINFYCFCAYVHSFFYCLSTFCPAMLVDY